MLPTSRQAPWDAKHRIPSFSPARLGPDLEFAFKPVALFVSILSDGPSPSSQGGFVFWKQPRQDGRYMVKLDGDAVSYTPTGLISLASKRTQDLVPNKMSRIF